MILDHAGLQGAPRFQMEDVKNITGFDGSYNSTLVDDELEALGLLREHFAKPIADFQRIMDLFFPQLNFTLQSETW
jgi:hypothetical protein